MFPIIFNFPTLRRRGASTTVLLGSDQNSSRFTVPEVHCAILTFELWRLAPVAEFELFCCVVTNSKLVLPTHSQFSQNGSHENWYVGAIVSSRNIFPLFCVVKDIL